MQSDARWRRSGDIVVAHAAESAATRSMSTAQERSDCGARLMGKIHNGPSVVLKLPGVVESNVAVPVRPGELLDLADPIRIGVVVHHGFCLAPRLGRSTLAGQGVDQDRCPFWGVGAVRKASVAVAREPDGRSGIAFLGAAKSQHELGFVEGSGGH